MKDTLKIFTLMTCIALFAGYEANALKPATCATGDAVIIFNGKYICMKQGVPVGSPISCPSPQLAMASSWGMLVLSTTSKPINNISGCSPSFTNGYCAVNCG